MQSPSPVLFSSAEVLSWRHAPTWLLLASVAGAVNAGAFLASERFVSHVTGTVTRMGLDVGAPTLLLDYGLVLLAFIAGAMASVLAIQARVWRGKKPLHALPLLVVAAVLVLAGVAGHFGAFGPMGGEVEEVSDFAFLCILAFAMGLMNATVASSTALAVRTTHMTGPATDFGVSLASAMLANGTARKEALRLAALRGGKILAFSVGAALMVVTMGALGYLAFVYPALFLVVAAARSFLPAASKAPSSVTT
jgi:uncharacterized membrane protein YoaK (UPF0700 family)